MTDLIIKYDHGQMLIHLEEFLTCRQIAKVRKLVKLIQRSYNPELIELMSEHIHSSIEPMTARAKVNVNKYVDAVDRVKELECKKNLYEQRYRNSPKRSEIRKKFLEQYNLTKSEWQEEKFKMSSYKKEALADTRNLEFYKKLRDEVFS